MKILQQDRKKTNGHYEVPLPFKCEIQLPNNRWIAMKRAESLKRKFMKDKVFQEDYEGFISNMLIKGYARPAETNEKRWFIPHHGVYHSTKQKIRVVFDCSSEVNGQSLNKNLLQGPDLTNQWVGVLCRFRQEKVAIMADIDQCSIK